MSNENFFEEPQEDGVPIRPTDPPGNTPDRMKPNVTPGTSSPPPSGSRYGSTQADVLPIAKPHPAMSSTPSTHSSGNAYGSTQADALPAAPLLGALGLPPGGAAIAPAQILGGESALSRYEVVHRIASGGMGSVDLARHRDMRNRWVALKRLIPISGLSPEQTRALVRQEADMLAGLKHNFIVQVFDFAIDVQGPYMTMEFVAGPPGRTVPGWPLLPDAPSPPQTLEQRVHENGPLPIAEALAVAAGLASAVALAHRLGVIHRDIKPANVLLDAQGAPKLTDFGIARELSGESEMAGARLGTPGYMAPEQEVDARMVDARADLFGIGATLWFALTGADARNFKDDQAPVAVRPLLAQALHRDREKRFQRAEELENALQRLRGVASASAGDLPARGQCLRCGHLHDLTQLQADKRSRCEECGVALLEPCFQCQRQNYRWVRFCECGENLPQRLQAEKQRWDLLPQQIANALQNSRYPQAIEGLESLAKLRHSELEYLRAWAIGELPKTRQQYESVVAEAARQVQNANNLSAQGDFDPALEALATIPESLRTAATNTLADEIQKKRDDYKHRYKRVRQRNQNKDWDDLRQEVEALLLIKRTKPLEDLLDFLHNYEIKKNKHEHAACWKNYQDNPGIDTARAYVTRYPEGEHYSIAAEDLAVRLREYLLENIINTDVRDEYLRYRTPTQRAADETRATYQKAICMIPFLLVGPIAMPIGLAFSPFQWDKSDNSGGKLGCSIVLLLLGIALWPIALVIGLVMTVIYYVTLLRSQEKKSPHDIASSGPFDTWSLVCYWFDKEKILATYRERQRNA